MRVREAETSEQLDRLVQILAWRLLSQIPRDAGIEMSDLIQAGNLGLMQAARSFSSVEGAKLAGYAKFRIRGEMLDTVRRHSGRGSRLALRRAIPAGADTHPVEEIAARAEDDPLDRLTRAERRTILREEIARLPKRDRTVVGLRYVKGFTLREIGEFLCVKESRACQIHHEAMERLRRALALRGVTGLWQLL
ncbi:MAG TPA: sigma-70 family RNA polymerase sigma factor [Bryobacteraceae bacterium]|nr:sigma-70 family RNA polymerase sigma factor [Bryobacteraceae bacterium]